MAAVIVLITLLVGLLSGLTAGLAQQNISAITGLAADHVAFSVPDGQPLSYANSSVTEQQWRRWSGASGVPGAEPIGIATTRAISGERSVPVAAFGVLPGSRLSPYGDQIDQHRVVMSTTAAKDLDVAAGDPVTLAGQWLTVAAVRGDASFSHIPVVWTSLYDWQRIAPPGAGSSAGSGADDGAAGGPYATVIAVNAGGGTGLAAADAV
ncbi:MAG: ABC transporter permease, partial [Micromonosporaceae bacterium]